MTMAITNQMSHLPGHQKQLHERRDHPTLATNWPLTEYQSMWFYNIFHISSVVLLGIWSYILSMIAGIPNTTFTSGGMTKGLRKVCVCVCLRMCILMCIFGFRFMYIFGFGRLKQNIYIICSSLPKKPWHIAFHLHVFSQDTKRPTIGPRFDSRNPTNSSGSLAVGVGGWGCRGSPFYSNQDSTPSSTNESLTDICYAITVLYEKSTQNNLSINIWQIME